MSVTALAIMMLAMASTIIIIRWLAELISSAKASSSWQMMQNDALSEWRMASTL